MGFASAPPPPPSEDTRARIAVLDRNGTVARRVARVLRAASGLLDVAVEADPATLRALITDDPVLLACDAADLDLALEWAGTRYPSLKIITWTSGSMDPVLDAARKSPKLVSLVGWPSFASMPRPWELSLAARRIFDQATVAPRLGEIFSWGATVVKFRPRTSRERDDAVTEVTKLSERAGAMPRIAQRVGEVAHEMLMNAMYDAPRDPDGSPRYAHDRKQDIELTPAELPTFRFAADGVHVALQTVDPFGALKRQHVLDGVQRGRAGATASGGIGEAVLDTSFGGAGLGMARIYQQSTVLLVDVVPSRYTSVTAFFDLDVNPREARTLPVSLHLFESTGKPRPSPET